MTRSPKAAALHSTLARGDTLYTTGLEQELHFLPALVPGEEQGDPSVPPSHSERAAPGSHRNGEKRRGSTMLAARSLVLDVAGGWAGSCPAPWSSLTPRHLLSPLLSAVSGFRPFSSSPLGAMENRGATVRQLVGRRLGM